MLDNHASRAPQIWLTSRFQNAKVTAAKKEAGDRSPAPFEALLLTLLEDNSMLEPGQDTIGVLADLSDIPHLGLKAWQQYFLGFD